MNRLLTLASGGLFAAGLAILPISAFAQQNGPDAKADTKPVAPATQQMGTADVKAPAPGVKAEATTKRTTATKAAAAHHVKHAAATPASAPKAAAPMTNAATGARSPATTPAQPKTVDQSKS